MRRLFLLSALLVGLAACTQPPAQVQVKGGQDYSRHGDGQYGDMNYYDGRSDTTREAERSPAPVYYDGINPVDDPQSVTVSDISEQQPVTSGSPWSPPPESPNNQASPDSVSPDSVSVAAPSGGKMFVWPVESKNVLSSFGPKSTGKANEGINIGASEGSPVWAAADGEIVYADNSLKGYGNMVLIKHTGGHTTTYAHLSRMTVQKYDRVRRGDIIGYVGQTGSIQSPQLYYAVRSGTDAVNPESVTSH